MSGSVLGAGATGHNVHLRERAMTHLLHLDASARRASFSRRLTAAFAETWRAAHPGGGYTYRDLAADPVPPIGETWTELCDHVLAHEITEIGRYREAVRTP